MRTARTLLLITLLVLTAGCALIPHRQTGSSHATPHTTPPVVPVNPTGSQIPAATTYVLSGRALDDRNNLVSGVTVGLKLTTAQAGCSSCGFYTATTGHDGTYQLAVPNGIYVGACAAGTLTCRFTAAPSNPTVTITISGGGLTADVAITAPSGQPTQPSDDSGTTVSGHVYTQGGKPVSGATVEFRKAGCPNCMPQPFTTTDAQGAYSITLDSGVYNAECPEDNCGVKGGDGGPFPVTVPPDRTVNFVICNSPYDLPACLRS